jgi:hypothetical protein
LKRIFTKTIIFILVFIWLSINYKILSTIYCNYFCDAKVKVEEGEIDIDSMTPEEQEAAFKKLQEQRAKEISGEVSSPKETEIDIDSLTPEEQEAAFKKLQEQRQKEFGN